MNQTVSKSFLLCVLAAASIFSIAESSNVFERRDEEKSDYFERMEPPSDSSDDGDSDHHRIVGGNQTSPGDYPYFGKTSTSHRFSTNVILHVLFTHSS
jgi:hypothetical protein